MRGPRPFVGGLRRDLVGYVYQRPSDNFLSHLTVESICALRAAVRMPQGGSTRAGCSTSSDIGHRIDHLPSELSGGEQQRAAFAQALATGANIIVADEPTAELDGASSEGVLDRVRALAGEGVTFLLATHDPAVMSIADERFELEHGRVKGTVPLSRRILVRRRRRRSGGPTQVWPPGCSTRSLSCD